MGSVRLVVNATSGEVVQRIDYDEFGRVLFDSNQGFTMFGFAGGIYDQHTKLTRFGARDFDTKSCRWLSKDPIGCLSSSSNFYEYAQNNPINFKDPNGLQLIPVGPSPIIQQTIKEIGNFFGAIGDFVKNYQDMREANTINADKYFHCKANCEASKRGLGGYLAAVAISEGRELSDQYIKGDPASACNADRAANRQGRQGKESNCRDRCNSLRPRGLDQKY